jgi:hypothetical protein
MIAGNQERSAADLALDEEQGYDLKPLIELSIGAVKNLIRQDRASEKHR